MFDWRGMAKMAARRRPILSVANCVSGFHVAVAGVFRGLTAGPRIRRGMDDRSAATHRAPDCRSDSARGPIRSVRAGSSRDSGARQRFSGADYGSRGPRLRRRLAPPAGDDRLGGKGSFPFYFLFFFLFLFWWGAA